MRRLLAVVGVVLLASIHDAPAAPERRAAAPALPAKTKPLSEMGGDRYKGVEGGLYPGGSAVRPAAHETLGLALAKQVKPLDAKGTAAADGVIALLAIGMSNTTQEFSTFKRRADADAGRNPKLVLVDGAQGGMAARQIEDPGDHGTGTRYWATVDERLAGAHVSRAQVEVAWIKQADMRPSDPFPGHAKTLQQELERIVDDLHDRFPNLRLVYLSSRTYGGYAKTSLNPEPYAFESGFAVKWLIEDQVKGEKRLNADPAKGAAKAPWLAWGPYLWANGSTKRADGFSWELDDVRAADGTHPSDAGCLKVAEQLWTFFTTDTTAKTWFLAN
jgi:hypothetical protein